MLLRSLKVLWLLLLAAAAAQGQTTKIKLSSVSPGTEKVQLVFNGDFEYQGPVFTNTHPLPDGWSRQADMFAGPGTNRVITDRAAVAQAFLYAGAAVCKYERLVTLQSNTDYVVSAYLWNFGDSANHLNVNVDLNDVPQDPQLSLGYGDQNADKGYFLYRSFNTTNSGTRVTLRVFYDGLTGTGAAPAYYPLAAQWDNVAITKAADFAPPQASGNLRPVVNLFSPANGTNIILDRYPFSLSVTASAEDFDGTITQLELYAGTNKIGEGSAGPLTVLWTNPVSGAYQFTAQATDNEGATTLSPPSAAQLAVMPQPVPLSITSTGANLSVSWPVSATASVVQWASDLSAAAQWKLLTDASVADASQNVVTLSNRAELQLFRLGPEVDASTLTGKLLMGYQGWFSCPGDGSAVNQWVHWFRNNAPYATNATVDFWPDISELDNDELFPTAMHLTNGTVARLFSAYNQKTVVRHFKWMKDNHLDGVFLQRFSSSLTGGSMFDFRNQVAVNVRVGAGTYGRVFAVMYDISGQPTNTLISTLTNDWAYLVNTLQLTASPQYLRHHGKPVVAIWGFGFTDRPGTPQDAQTVIGWFKNAGCTVMGGVPTHWADLHGDSQTNAAWAAAYRAFDIVSPWAVGRYSTEAGADSFKQNQIVPDLLETQRSGIEYMPVVFPGFSWHNLKGAASPLNQIPRNGGSFYWRQIYNAVSAGCTMIYGAMFDEVDEGTAMFKMAPTLNELPVEAQFVPLNIDGQALPSDWYLRLADQAGKMLRGEIPLRTQLPITP